jgi:hypothetical protein
VLDDQVQVSIDDADEAGFVRALGALLAAVRERGTRLPDTAVAASDLVLPAGDSSLTETVALLGPDGLVPD